MNIPVDSNFFFLPVSAIIAFIVDLALKGTALLILCYFLAKVLKRRSAATKSLVWTIAFISILMLPFLHINLPTIDFLPSGSSRVSDDDFYIVRIMSADESASFDFVNDTTATDDHGPVASGAIEQESGFFSFMNNISIPHWSVVAVALWLLGFLYLVMRWIISYITVRGLTRSGDGKSNSEILKTVDSVRNEQGIKIPVMVRISEGVHIPFIWGIVAPKLVLPAEAETWDRDSLKSVIIHELAHVKRFDIVRLTLFRIACALSWFNPFVWLASKKAKLEIEGACDDAVINAGHAQEVYARRLLGFAVRMREVQKINAVGLAMVRKSAFEERITNIVDQRLDRKPANKVATALVSLVILMAIIPLAALNTVETPTGESSSAFSNYLSQDSGELLRVEDALRCFPAGNYSMIMHYDFEQMKRADSFDLYKELFNYDREFLTYTIKELPPTLRDSLHSMTQLTLTRYKFSEVIIEENGRARAKILLKPDGTPRKDTGVKSVMFLAIDDRQISFVNFGETIKVCRFRNLTSLIQMALSNGDILKTQINIGGRTVFRAEKSDGGNPYILPLETGELLLSNEVELLEKMYDAWSGNAPTILTEPGMSDFVSIGSELGQKWHLWNSLNQSHPSLLKLMADNGVSEEEINKRAERSEKGSQFAVQTAKIGKRIEELDLTIYGDEEEARTGYQWYQKHAGYRAGADSPAAVKTFYDAKIKGRDIRLDGLIVRVSNIWDDELIKLDRAATKAEKEWREEIKKKSQAEKDK